MKRNARHAVSAPLIVLFRVPTLSRVPELWARMLVGGWTTEFLIAAACALVLLLPVLVIHVMIERTGDELVTRHMPVIYRFFRTKVPDIAEDLVQETFLGALERRDTLSGESFRAYLLAVARRRLRDSPPLPRG